MVILDLEVLDINLKKIIEIIKHQKDAQRNSVQKEVLNSSPSFFSTSLVAKTLIRTTRQEEVCETIFGDKMVYEVGLVPAPMQVMV